MLLCNKNRKKENRLKCSLRVNVTSVRRGERKIRAGTKKTGKIRSSRSTSIPLKKPAVAKSTPRKKAEKHTSHISWVFQKQFTYRYGWWATLPETSVSRTGEERRRCVCVRQAETGGQRRRFGTFGEERSLVAERSAPGCGNIRLQTADQRRAVQPGRGAPGSHTAPAVTHSLPRRCGWVDCFCKQRERNSSSVLWMCVCEWVVLCTISDTA